MAELSDILILVIPLFFVILIYLQMCRTRTTKNSSSLKKEVKQLSSLPIVSITANDILLSKDMKIVDEGTKLALEMLAKHACIFLFVIVNNQEEADNLLEPISKEFEGLVDPDNILFTQTQLGRASMARALESLAHIDFDPEVVHQTSIFINSVLIASPEVDSQYAKWKGTTFKEFITRGSTDFFASFRH